MTGERDQALSQARARLQEAQDLRKEVSSVIEKKRRVEGEVERLRSHLVSVEESYTGELVAGEEREAGLRRRVAGLEDQIRMVSNNSTEATEEASQASTQVCGRCPCPCPFHCPSCSLSPATVNSNSLPTSAKSRPGGRCGPEGPAAGGGGGRPGRAEGEEPRPEEPEPGPGGLHQAEGARAGGGGAAGRGQGGQGAGQAETGKICLQAV